MFKQSVQIAILTCAMLVGGIARIDGARVAF
jgi:hypothetical protein